jgi:hypothetical protein
MKRNSRDAATAVANGAFEEGENNKHNGNSNPANPGLG